MAGGSILKFDNHTHIFSRWSPNLSPHQPVQIPLVPLPQVREDSVLEQGVVHGTIHGLISVEFKTKSSIFPKLSPLESECLSFVREYLTPQNTMILGENVGLSTAKWAGLPPLTGSLVLSGAYLQKKKLKLVKN